MTDVQQGTMITVQLANKAEMKTKPWDVSATTTIFT